MGNFWADNRDGKQAEDYVVHLLRSAGVSAERPKGGADQTLDLLAKVGDFKFSLEIKFDKMSSATGNLAIEHEKPKTGTPSGINVTRADFWVYVLRQPLAAYLVPVLDLKSFVANTRPKKSIKWAGDGNASIWVYSLDVILPIFYGLSETHPAERLPLMKGLLCKS